MKVQKQYYTAYIFKRGLEELLLSMRSCNCLFPFPR